MLLQERDPRALPFELDGEGQAALLIHGFTGSCAEMRPVGEALHRELGWKISAPLLPGHGTTTRDLEICVWPMWLEAVTKARNRLLERFSTVHLVGLSMGSLLCLELFRQRKEVISSLALLVPAVFMRTRMQRLGMCLSEYEVFCKLVPRLPKRPLPPEVVAYTSYPTRGVRELAALSRRAKRMQRLESPPTMIVYSETDETVDPRSAHFLFEHLSHPLNRVVRLDRSIHVATLGVEKDRLIGECLSFYREIAPRKLLPLLKLHEN